MDWLQEIEERWAKATPGPWEWEPDWGKVYWDEEAGNFSEKYADLQLRGKGQPFGHDIIPLRIDHYAAEWDVLETLDEPNEHDRAAIAAAPDDVARLIAEVKALARALGLSDRLEPYWRREYPDAYASVAAWLEGDDD